MKRLFVIPALLAVLMSGTVSTATARPAGDKNIVQTAVAAGQFKTLAALLGRAGLAGTLQRPGPYTVFAPTDDAFAKLPAGTVEDLLEDPEALKAILLYHVVEGKVTSDQVVGLTSADTVGGPAIAISTNDGAVYLNDTVKVVTTDIEARYVGRDRCVDVPVGRNIADGLDRRAGGLRCRDDRDDECCGSAHAAPSVLLDRMSGSRDR